MNVRLRQWLEGHPRAFRGALATRRACGRLQQGAALGMRPWMTGRYLRDHATRKLHLGAGPHTIPGWLNTDLLPTSLRIAYLDVTKPFPLPDASVDHVFSEHMIEHVPYDKGVHMLRECARVLRPGGRVRIATPDLEAILDLRRDDLSGEQREYIHWFIERNEVRTPDERAVFVINHFFYSWGHRFLYDRRTLGEALERAGFSDLREYRPGESDHPELRGLERHGAVLQSERWNRFETIVMEARRG